MDWKAGQSRSGRLGDTIQLDMADSVVWYHRNTKSPWAGILKHQGLSDADRFAG